MKIIYCTDEVINQLATQLNMSSTLLKDLLEVIDTYKGVIYGSCIHRFLSKLSYDIDDIDVLFADKNNLLTCKEKLIEVYSKNNPDTDNFNSEISYDNGNSLYTYNEYISKICIITHLNASYDNNSKSETFNGLYKYHQVLLKSDLFKENTKIDLNTISPLEVVKALTEYIIPDKFLCNFYYQGCIYQTCDDICQVETTSYYITSALNQDRFNKYINRGVKVLINNNSIIALQAERNKHLAIAKKQYKSEGLVVIPLSSKDLYSAGKCPFTIGWTEKTTDFDFAIEGNINIGIVCGPNSGIICVDVDKKDHGIEFFNKMVMHYGQLPVQTPIQHTGGGGFHYIFKYDSIRMRNMNTKIKCPKYHGKPIGIDILIQNSQFVVSPSFNNQTCKYYKWIKPFTSKENIPELPEWLYSLYENENIQLDGTIIIKPKITYLHKLYSNKIIILLIIQMILIIWLIVYWV